MAANTLNILKPSVNNLTARIFVRAAGLDFEEQDVWGATTTPEFLQKDPAHLTPLLEEEGLPRGSLWESCAIMQYLSNKHDLDELDVWGKKTTPEFLGKNPADLTPLLEEEGLPKGSLWESCAIMQYLCNKHGLDRFYPRDPGERAMVDSAMFYLIGTLYPLLARATYPTLGFAQYAGEVATSDADEDMKAKAAKDAEAALAEPLDVYRAFFLDGKRFIGGDTPSIADIRLAATLEFLRAIDYDFPAWAEEFMTRMEDALGEAYSEPAADVRGYIDYVKSQSG